MPSIKQLKQEISEAAYFTPEQKVWLTKGINRALESITQREINAPTKPRTVKKAKGLMTIEEWEYQGEKLNVGMLRDWVVARNLDPTVIAQMVAEFRSEMMAKGKQYANFRSAFQTYLTKGYLSKPLSSCVKQETAGTIVHNRGGQL